MLTYKNETPEQIKARFEALDPTVQVRMMEHYQQHYTVRFNEEQRAIIEKALTMYVLANPKDEEAEILRSMSESLPEDNKDAKPWFPLEHGWAL